MEYAKPARGPKLLGLKGTLPESGHSGLETKPFVRESLQIVAGAEAQGQVVGHANRILQKACVFVGVGMSNCRAEVLDVIVRNSVGISSQRRKFQARLLRLERKLVHLDGVENVLPSGQRREEVVDPCQQCIAAEFPGISFALDAEGLG